MSIMTPLQSSRLLFALLLVIESAHTSRTSAFRLSNLVSSVRRKTQTTNTIQEAVIMTPLVFDRTDSQLFYTNGVEFVSEDTMLAPSSGQRIFSSSTTANTATSSISSSGISNASAISFVNQSLLTTATIRPMDLPRRSPPKDVLERQRLLLDIELSVGRVAMIAAMILLGGEIFTGLSMMTQVSEVLH
jgi:hypothetical protein